MTIEAWIDEDLAREKSKRHMPIVTIFGAGISGLTLAHELVERGFGVQVVESRRDPDDEYSCEVGGLAANQVGRVPADIERVHPYLFSEEDKPGEDAEDPEGRSVRVWVVKTGEEQLELSIDKEKIELATNNLSAAEIATKIREGAIAAGFDASPDGDVSVVLASKRPGKALRVSAWAGNGPSELVRSENVGTLAHLRAAEMEPVQQRFPIPQRVRFDRDLGDEDWREIEDEHCRTNAAKLDDILAALQKAHEAYAPDIASSVDKKLGGSDALSPRMRRREEFLIEIRGHTDGDGAPGDDRKLSRLWASYVRDELLARNAEAAKPIPELEQRILLIGVGGGEPVGNPRRKIGRRRSNRVEVRIVEHHLPGEHGYRFFPGFYRHLFDTMRRTPILDAQGRETGDTAFDQLEAVDVVDVALEDEERPHRVPVRAARSLEELRELMRMHLDPERLGLKERDLLLFTLRMAQFLTSSRARRAGEYEAQSWWDFLVGTDENGDPRYQYTAAMARLLRTTPEALVAMRADETDARTQGSVYAQLLTDVLRDGSEANRTLNGPTSEVWLDHWKRYLVRQGVRFFVGELSKLEWHGDELLPVVTRKHHECGEAALQIILADPRTLQLQVNGRDVSVQIGAGDTLRDAALKLGREINGVEDSLVAADASDADLEAGRLRLASRFEEQEVQLRFRRGVGPARAWIFGEPGLEVTPVGEISLEPRLGDVIRVSPLGDSHLLSALPDEALIWIRRRERGLYGVEIDGRAVQVPVDEPPPNPVDIRQSLLLAIQEKAPHVAAEAIGVTGIRLRHLERMPVKVNVERWAERVGHGVDLRLDRRRYPQLDALRGNAMRVRTDDPALGLLGASAELSDEPFVQARFEAEQGQPASGGGPDFYVMALPFDEVSRLVWQAHEDGQSNGQVLDGCLAQLMAFEQATARRTAAGAPIPLVRDGLGRPPLAYPLRDLSGIQFYFAHQVRVGRGHTYYPRAPWGLSSISQIAYWRERMSRRSAFLGQLSVDIGRFYEPLPGDPALRPSAWNTPRRDLPERVWEQIVASLRNPLNERLPKPAYYHLDQAIAFACGKDGEQRKAGPEGAVIGVAKEGETDFALEIEGTKYEVALQLPAQDVSHVPALLAAKINDIDSSAPFLAEALPTNADPSVGPAHRLRVAASARSTRVVIRVVETAPLPFQLRVGGGAPIESSGNGKTPDEIRDALVAGVNALAPGSIATPLPDSCMQIDFASPTRLSAFVPGASKPLLVIESGASLSVRLPEGKLSIQEEDATPCRNATPFLINNPGVWKQRPGLRSMADAPPADMRLYWKEDTEIYYHLTKRRWLMVGNQMATFTRLSTMESANESARHAVASILHALLQPAPDPPYYNGQELFLGDYPDFWDPEEHEFEDLSVLRRLDAAVYASTSSGAPLPHAFEILRLGEWIAGLPEDLVKDEFPGHVSKLWGHALARFEEELGFTEGDEFMQAIRAVFREFLNFDPGP